MSNSSELGETDLYDVVIVGGGPAGLSAALMLGRARRRVLVIDAGAPRNAPAAQMHGFPSRDGMAPTDFLRSVREQLSAYDVSMTTGRVHAASRSADGFLLSLANGDHVNARRLLACTGIVDVLPDVAGLRECWGRDVVHCPYCHGWEHRNRRIGVLATGAMSIHQALLFRQWTDHLTLLLHTGPPPSGEQAEELTARRIPVVRGTVTRVETVGGRLSGVRLATGQHIDLDALAVAPIAAPRSDLLRGLGLHPRPHPSGMGEHIPADETGRTEIDGVWVAGNLTNPALNVLGSANAGAIAAGAINADLITQETAQAVRAARSA
ncbi:NAD(P)/FAD-dependent oxidoreductase [Micromonosporaceae bacterium B7E4]